MLPARLHPSLAKRFRSGRPCLDFAHTGGSGEWVEPELLMDPAGLARFLGHVLGLPAVQARPLDLRAAHRLRAALWQLAHARVEGGQLPAGPVAVVNALASRPPPVPRLDADGMSAPAVATATAALSAVARDAIDLFSGPLAHRIRVCAAPDCALLFVDASRPGSRRWCSMERCGNLAKTRTHRSAAAGSPGRSAQTPPPTALPIA